MRFTLLLAMAGLLAACPSGPECRAGEGLCDGVCTDVGTNRRHCGACGNACETGESCVDGACLLLCPAGLTACAGRCVDASVDPGNCGSCGTRCEAGELCSAGRCATTCQEGHTECGGRCTDLTSDRAHCGRCDRACGPGEICAVSECALSCPTGTTHCGDRCVSTLDDRANCGFCGHACGAGEVCDGGACVLSCQSGDEVCDGRCTTLATDLRNCGRCGNRCEAGEYCSASECVPSCPADALVCDGRCVDPGTDRANCGRCGHACEAGQVCTAGLCVLSCQDGLLACGNLCVDPSADRRHCGRCGHGCGPGEVCSGGTCAPTCQANLVECAGLCVDSRFDGRNCGGCGRPCAAGTVCSDGVCQPTCTAGTTFCSGRCAPLESDRANCGHCGNACADGFACVAGACVLSCQAGLTACDGTCVDTTTDPRHCGACGSPCAPGKRCGAGQCVLTCQAGLTDCNGRCVDLQADARRCGSCSTACGAGEACVAGLCDLQCGGGTTECGNRCVDLQTTRTDCGQCGLSCAPDQLCRLGRCVTPTCVSTQSCGPLAEAGSPRVVRVGAPVTLDARASNDPLGGAITFHWSQVAGSPVTLSVNDSVLGAQPTFTSPASPQQLVFQLVVTDESGRSSAPDSVTVEVVRPPVARITPTGLTLKPGEPGQLSGATSSDPANSPLTYAWTVDSGPISVGSGSTSVVTVTPANNASGYGVVRLVVRNGYVDSDPITADVIVDANASPPVVDAGEPQTVRPGALVRFAGTASSSSPTETFSWSWRQLSGATVAIANPTTTTASVVAPAAEGSLVFELTVTGSRGGQARDTVVVTVRDDVPPSVTSTSPLAGALGSPFAASATFDEPVLESSIVDSNVLVTASDGTTVPATLTYDAASRTARLVYLRPLVAGNAYTLRIRNVRDRALVPNAMPAEVTVAFTARGPAWRLFGEATPAFSEESTEPTVLWTPDGVRVAGRRKAPAACAGRGLAETVGFLTALDVNESSGLLTPAPLPSCSYTAQGGSGYRTRRAVLASGQAWIAARAGPTTVLRRVGTDWTAVPSPPLFNQGTESIFSDGNVPYVLVSPNWDPLKPWTGSGWGNDIPVVVLTVPRFITLDGRFIEWGGSRYNASISEFWLRSGSGWTSAGTISSPSGTGAGVLRLTSYAGRLVAIRYEEKSGLTNLAVWMSTGTNPPFTFDVVGGGPANPAPNIRPSAVDGVMFGSRLYVVFLVNQQLLVRALDLSVTGATWVDVPGPNGVNLSRDPTCSIEEPSLDAGPDGVWLAWSENCAGTTSPAWRTLVRKLE